MKILMPCAYYAPEIAASMYLLTNINEALASEGHEVHVYAPIPTRGIDDNVRNEYKNKKLETQCDGRLLIHRFGLSKEKKNTLARAMRYVILNLKTLWIGLTKKADLVFLYSTPPTNGLVAYAIRKLRRIPVIYCIQDMFPESLVATGLTNRTSLIYHIGELVEKITYKGADHYITISDEFKEDMVKKGVAEDKITVVRNWVDENAVTRVSREENRVLKKYQLDIDKFYVTYCGNIGFTQNIELILQTAEALRGQREIEFLLFGEGAYKEQAEQYIKEHCLSNVKILPFQDYEYISDVFSIGDAGIIASKAGVGGCSVPSKTWSYMSAECALLVSFDEETELVRIVKEADCGQVCMPDDVASLKQAILRLYQDVTLCRANGTHGRKYIMENLTRAVGAGKYVQTVEAVYAKCK